MVPPEERPNSDFIAEEFFPLPPVVAYPGFNILQPVKEQPHSSSNVH